LALTAPGTFGHFSVIQQAGGYRALEAGDPVELEWTAVAQDEYDYVAVWIQPL
jgi:cold shock CspA family protein